MEKGNGGSCNDISDQIAFPTVALQNRHDWKDFEYKVKNRTRNAFGGQFPNRVSRLSQLALSMRRLPVAQVVLGLSERIASNSDGRRLIFADHCLNLNNV